MLSLYRPSIGDLACVYLSVCVYVYPSSNWIFFCLAVEQFCLLFSSCLCVCVLVYLSVLILLALSPLLVLYYANITTCRKRNKATVCISLFKQGLFVLRPPVRNTSTIVQTVCTTQFQQLQSHHPHPQRRCSPLNCVVKMGKNWD